MWSVALSTPQDGDGLYLLVSEAGTRVPGDFGTVIRGARAWSASADSTVSLAAAYRAKRDEVRRQLSDGIDPLPREVGAA